MNPIRESEPVGKKPKLRLLWALVGVVVISLGVALLIPHPARSALPSSATEVREYAWDDNFHGDFFRLLKAKMPESDVAAYAARLGLRERYDTNTHGGLPLNFSGGEKLDWWNPPDSLAGAYFKHEPGKESFVMVGYRDGWVYFIAAAW